MEKLDLISFIIGIASSLVATYIFTSVRRVIDGFLSFLFNLLNPNSFNLSGTWEGKFVEPSAEDPEMKVQEIEKVKIFQVGTIIWAKSETQSNKRIFKYRLSVNHDIVMGTYRKSGTRGVTSGTGVIQLVVNSERNKLEGHATWMDSHSNTLESDDILWKQIARS